MLQSWKHFQEQFNFKRSVCTQCAERVCISFWMHDKERTKIMVAADLPRGVSWRGLTSLGEVYQKWKQYYFLILLLSFFFAVSFIETRPLFLDCLALWDHFQRLWPSGKAGARLRYSKQSFREALKTRWWSFRSTLKTLPAHSCADNYGHTSSGQAPPTCATPTAEPNGAASLSWMTVHGQDELWH